MKLVIICVCMPALMRMRKR